MPNTRSSLTKCNLRIVNLILTFAKGTVMQIEKALIDDRLRVSKVS